MIKVRVAPSPTGNLHIGTAQSALYNWLFARKNEGKFLLRIEDTDRERSTKEYEQSIFQALQWLDLKWDDEAIIQSNNLPRHRQMLEKLLNENKAFYCHHTKEELEEERKKQEIDKKAPLHACSYKKDPKGQEAGGIIRLAVDENSDRIISFDDHIRGKVEFRASLLGDFSIARTINDPLYHFVVVVDDADMKITHVLRGEDHISNTPKHILIYEALGFSLPIFAHLPLILASDRSKLSKRHGDTSALAYKKDYLPQAIINFLGSLSYTFSKEIISKEEMIKEFELEKVHKSGAVFDVKKLNWINSQYIKKLSPKEFREAVNLPDLSDKAIALITERLEKLSDVKNFDFLIETEKRLNYDPNLLLKLKKESSKNVVISSILSTAEIINEIGTENKDKLRKRLDDSSVKEFEGDRGVVYWPFRVSVTGKEKSPDPVDVANILGKKSTLERLEEAKKKLE